MSFRLFPNSSPCAVIPTIDWGRRKKYLYKFTELGVIETDDAILAWAVEQSEKNLAPRSLTKEEEWVEKVRDILPKNPDFSLCLRLEDIETTAREISEHAAQHAHYWRYFIYALSAHRALACNVSAITRFALSKGASEPLLFQDFASALAYNKELGNNIPAIISAINEGEVADNWIFFVRVLRNLDLLSERYLQETVRTITALGNSDNQDVSAKSIADAWNYFIDANLSLISKIGCHRNTTDAVTIAANIFRELDSNERLLPVIGGLLDAEDILQSRESEYSDHPHIRESLLRARLFTGRCAQTHLLLRHPDTIGDLDTLAILVRCDVSCEHTRPLLTNSRLMHRLLPASEAEMIPFWYLLRAMLKNLEFFVIRQPQDALSASAIRTIGEIFEHFAQPAKIWTTIPVVDRYSLEKDTSMLASIIRQPCDYSRDALLTQTRDSLTKLDSVLPSRFCSPSTDDLTFLRPSPTGDSLRTASATSENTSDGRRLSNEGFLSDTGLSLDLPR